MSETTEAARNRVEQVDMLALAGAIFAHLPGWTVEPRNPDVDDYAPPRMTYVRIKHVSGARCSISRSTWPPECNVSGYWPRLGDPNTGAEYAPRDRPRASFSPFRDPKALAKDIERRFLAVYLPEWATQREACDEATRKAVLAHQLAVALAQVAGSDLREHSEGWRFYPAGDLYEVRVTKWGTVHFERFSTDRPDFALAVLRLSAKWRLPVEPPAPPLCLSCFYTLDECRANPCDAMLAGRDVVTA